MTLDEFEALRLADLDGLYQDPAAPKRRVGRERRDGGDGCERDETAFASAPSRQGGVPASLQG